MAKSSSLTIRIDPTLKKDAEALYARFGIGISDAITMFLHKSLMVGGLPFSVTLEHPAPSSQPQKAPSAKEEKPAGAKAADRTSDVYSADDGDYLRSQTHHGMDFFEDELFDDEDY